ncbi:uncharacterized protein UPF0236 [Halanaerobium congolense]|uniref:Uncharacterized protein UPF0236 n=1 Tax=Halanaerobium congolense TaxID=54121 RepID=A0A318DTJ9_9FIRM|nr:ISLre2 family transposase [Halanaerobium congolense]PXV60007.1 uncharacterized protein UPF0236 [Halanaerobium congolense]
MELNLRILQNETNFKDLEKKIFKIVCKQAQEALKKLLEDIDQAILESRDKDKFKVKDIKKRTLDTLFGEVTIERRYYKDSNDEFRFLLDEYLNIPANERQSPALKEIALDLVKELPYRKAADKIDNILETSASHTAIFNWVQREGAKLSKEAETKQIDLFRDGLIPAAENEDRKEIEHLFVEVDGIHIPLQKDDKEKGELKLGMSYQSWEKRHPMSDEYNLTGKKYYGGVFSSDEFWKETAAEMYEDYSFSNGSISVLCGDGADWITTGLEFVPQVKVRFLDEYHLNKKLFRKLGRSEFVPKLLDNIEENDIDKLRENLKKARQYRQKKKDKEKVDELEGYLLKNWEFIQDKKNGNLGLPDEIRGLGAMESNIDKVLANRFKKRGMRWSREGARNLAKIIIADRNNTLEKHLNRINWEFKTDDLRKAYNTVQKKYSRSETEVLKATMPALKGPKSGQDWVKGLKNISDPMTNNSIV